MDFEHASSISSISGALLPLAMILRTNDNKLHLRRERLSYSHRYCTAAPLALVFQPQHVSPRAYLKYVSRQKRIRAKKPRLPPPLCPNHKFLSDCQCQASDRRLMFMLMWLLGKCLNCLYEEHMSNYPEGKTTPLKYMNRRAWGGGGSSI